MYGHRTLAKYAVNCNRLLSSAPVKTEAKGNELSKHCTGVRRAKEDGGDAGRRQKKPATALIVIPGQAEVGSEGWGGAEVGGALGGGTLARFQEGKSSSQLYMRGAQGSQELAEDRKKQTHSLTLSRKWSSRSVTFEKPAGHLKEAIL